MEPFAVFLKCLSTLQCELLPINHLLIIYLNLITSNVYQISGTSKRIYVIYLLEILYLIFLNKSPLIVAYLIFINDIAVSFFSRK